MNNNDEPRDQPRDETGRLITVTARTKDGYRRAGMAFSTSGTKVDVDATPIEGLRAIHADPQLAMEREALLAVIETRAMQEAQQAATAAADAAEKPKKAK